MKLCVNTSKITDPVFDLTRPSLPTHMLATNPTQPKFRNNLISISIDDHYDLFKGWKWIVVPFLCYILDRLIRSWRGNKDVKIKEVSRMAIQNLISNFHLHCYRGNLREITQTFEKLKVFIP